MARTILHVDLNNFYASVERILNPNLADKYVGVCGSVENRHGIILAKSENAKRLGVKTGMTVNEALKACPQLVLVESRHESYIKYSNLVRNIYRDYTDRVEPFGIDECWLDVTESLKLFGSGEKIADEIRSRVKNETGLTVSVGVSFNKVFAKLGSDLKKPDATTVISLNDFELKIWNLPVSDLLFVGKSTADKLRKINVNTIGDLANADKEFICKKFGKIGEVLHSYANGLDDSPVLKDGDREPLKSIGNSITAYRDLTTIDDVKIVLTSLAESVSARLIESGLGKANTLTVYVRDKDLKSFTRQCKLEIPTALPEDFVKTALELFIKHYKLDKGVRTLGVSVSDFTGDVEQLTIYDGEYKKKEKLNDVVNRIKSKYGNGSVLKGIVLKDKKLCSEKNNEIEQVVLE